MRYIMALLLSLALAVPAFAGFEGPNASTGGFAGPGPQTITKAAQAGPYTHLRAHETDS